MKYKRLLACILSAVIASNTVLPAVATETSIAIESVADETAEENLNEEKIEIEQREECTENFRDTEVNSKEKFETMNEEGIIDSGFIPNDKGGISWFINDDYELFVEGKGDIWPHDEENSWEKYAEQISYAEIRLSDVKNLGALFGGFTNMNAVDLSKLDTSQVTSMNGMFCGCESLTELDLSGFDTSQVKYMNGVFAGCTSLRELNLSGFDTSQVTDMSLMFRHCFRLEDLDVSGFDTSQVTDMRYMFDACQDITELDLSKFDVSKVTDMTDMVINCDQLQRIGVPIGISSDVYAYLDGKWYSSDGRQWLYLPQGLKKSIVIQKNSIPKDDTEDIPSQMQKVSFNNHEYCLFNADALKDVLSYDDAKKYCELLGGQLATITTEEENEFLYNYVKESGYTDAYFGLSDAKNEGTWKWITGEKVEYVNWHQGEPNGENELEDYAMFYWKFSDGTWNDGDFGINTNGGGTNFICEWENEDEEAIIVQINDLEINGRGQAYARFVLKDAEEQILRNQEIIYSFDDDTYKSASSDMNGYVTILLPELENTTGKTENITLQARVELAGVSDDEDVKYNVKINVAVHPISFSQKWELGAGGSLGVSAIMGAKAGIGVADAKASLGEIGATGSTTGRLTIENSWENEQRELTMFQSYNRKVIEKLEVGPAGEIGLLGSKGKLEVISASQELATGYKRGIGLKIENYDPTNMKQVKDVGKFLLGSMALAKGNYMLTLVTDFLGFDYYNQVSSETSVEIGAGIGVGKISFSDKTIGEIANTGTKKVLSHSLEADLSEKTNKRTFEMSENIEGGLGSIPHTDLNILSEQLGHSMKLTATKKNGKLDSIAVEGVVEDENGKLLLKEKEVKNLKISYEDKEAEKLYQSIPAVKSFVKGNTYYFLDSAQKKLLKDLDSSSANGKYAKAIEKQKIISEKLSFELGLGVAMDLGCSLEGINSYEYEIETGDYIGGRKYISSETNIEDLVKSEKLTLKEFVKEPLEAMVSEMKNFLNDIKGSIKDGVSNAGATIKGAAESTVDWIAHIMTINRKRMNLNTVQCYEIATFSLEDDSEGVALTIGDPYIVYVTDQNGAEVTDYSESPLELSLSYTDEMLYAAGATAQDVDHIAVYLHSEEKCGYIYVGGTVDTENKTVSVIITQPGQYVLAIDTLSPEINDFNVSDASKTPTIQVGFEEMSFFKEFSMKIDGQEVINSQNWEDYFEGSQKRISYKVENELSEGEHIVSVYAVDSVGNAMKDVATFSFVVDTELPELSKMVVSVDDKTLRVRAWSDHLDVKSAVAKISWTNDKEETVTKEYAMDVMEGYYTVMCKPENNALFATVSVITVDALGNRCESDAIIKNFENPEEDVTNDLWIRFVDGNGEKHSEYEYSGTQIKPQVQIFEGTDLLTAKKDYTISYSKNVNVGTATITVNGKGNYKGKETENFVIVPKDIGAEDIVAEDIAVAANGKQQLKVPTVKYGKLKLSNKKNKDFTVTWPDTSEGAYKEAGAYVIKVTGNGNFTGEREVQLLIGEKTASKLSVSKIASRTYTGTAIEIPGLIIKDGKTVLTENVDYTVSYENNTQIGTAKVIITGIAPKYIGSKTVTFKITGIAMSKVKIETETLPKSVTYNGQVHEPKLKLYYQKDKKSEKVDLVKDVDYKIAYSKNQNAGKATIDIEGLGAYSGKVKKTFTIKPYDVKTNDAYLLIVEDVDPVLYAKGGAKPQPTVRFDGKELEVGKDYTLSYSNNKVVTGEKTKKLPKVTLKFKGNFKNSISEEFIIKAQSLDNMSISVVDKVYSKKKNAWKSLPVITDLDGKKLSVGTDYEKTLLYYLDAKCTQPVESEVLDADTEVWVKVVGKNNYANSEIVTGYRIVASSIKTAKVTISVQQYTGKAIEPDYQDIKSVKVNKQVLEAGTDYEIVANSYQNNIKTGTATMKIRGKGNYGDVLTVKFSIQKKNFIWRWFDENVL